MAKDLFSVTIFFIVFRETIEAAIIVSVLLSFVEQLMVSGGLENEGAQVERLSEEEEIKKTKRILRRMRIQIWAGTLTGFVIAVAVGSAFIAACIIIYIMGLTFLKMDQSRVKWRIKLSEAFAHRAGKALFNFRGNNEGGEPERQLTEEELAEEQAMKKKARSGKYAIFFLPFITVMREGLEAIVFVGGVSLGQDGASIPIAAIVGLVAGIFVGWCIYRTGSTLALHWFLIVSTCFLFLIGSGLFSKGVYDFEYYRFSSAVGGDVAESGNGPGSFQVAGNVWHLEYGNPEPGAVGTNGGWQIFNAILGWNNTASLGSILSYCSYWIAVIIGLAVMKWHEGRLTVFGRGSKAHSRIQARAELKRVAEAQAVEAGSAEGQALEGFEKQYEGSSEEGAARNTTHLDKNDDSHDVTLNPMTEKSL
ncbi:high-affinity iron transporter [Cryptococcus deuterogattii 99/473]|uniref:High-affinity iron transporter n=1 Tax=Cryptococcus deuterogattii Ram5 TaxID=1296110 RepID=A0A0D0V7A8_9TREE|nr:high-affinity iron transporter [Cryptococcus deuterogattii Ram5]KIY56901.1 high-affinity iron transporter [Cryptococcus deuterogattii 99/473]